MKRVFDDLSLFCSVVETGSLKAASKALNIPHSTVSRRIDALEASLGLHLLHRSTREVRVTPRGQQLYEDSIQQLQALNSAIEIAIDAEVQFKGALKVSMPVRAGIDFLGGWLIDFAAQHEHLHLEIELSNENRNLIRGGVDLAFRVGPLVDSSAIALRLWDIHYSICATDTFIRDHDLNDAISLESLSQLPTAISLPIKQWSFTDQNQQTVNLIPDSALTVDDLGLARHAVQTDKYIALLPDTMIEGTNIRKLQIADHRPLTRTIYAYYFGRRHSISQIRHIVEYVRERNKGMGW